MLQEVSNTFGGIQVTVGPPARVSQGIPLAADGSVAISIGRPISYFSQGLPIDANGSVACTQESATQAHNGLLYDASGYVTLESLLNYLSSSISLLWNGVDAYADLSHAPWEASGYGDKIEFSFTANDPGNGVQDIAYGNENGGFFILRIYDTSAPLAVVYTDIDGTTTRVLSGPAALAGVKYSGFVRFDADGVVLEINGTEYTSSSVAGIATSQVTEIPGGTTNHFNGTIHALRFINSTPLQGANGVVHNGIDISCTVPAITLTNATISFSLLYATGDQDVLTGSVDILTVSSDLFVLGANVTELRVDGVEYASETLVDGQHYDVEIDVNGGTLTTIGVMASGAVMGTLTVEV